MEFSGTAEGARACRDQARMTRRRYATSIYHHHLPGPRGQPWTHLRGATWPLRCQEVRRRVKEGGRR